MRIRTLLSFSHTLVIGIFIVAFLTIFFYLTRPPGPPPGPASVEQLSVVLRQGHTGDELQARTTEIGFRDLHSLDLIGEDGVVRRMLGPPGEVETPGFVDDIRREDHLLEDRRSGGVHIFWVGLDIDGPKSHVGRLELHRQRDQFFADVRRNIMVACSVAFVAVLAIALILSRVLAQPIRNLALLVDRFGREGYGLRSSVKGTAELEELSQSFNRMAEYIENNTNELRERKEEAERTEALRRQFLSDVSHNLRTPLAAVMGWNDALIEGVAEDEELYRSRIRREILHITKTVQRLLELSRWERSAPVLLKENTLLSELLLEVAENLQEAAEQAGVTLSFEGLKPDLAIHADRQKARDVFQILLENVVEHAGPGVHATVTVETGENEVFFTVEDDGKGLPETFDGAVDMERGASEVGRACLGLAIASRLVAAHGGELRLRNRKAGGTVARFSFPIAE